MVCGGPAMVGDTMVVGSSEALDACLADLVAAACLHPTQCCSAKSFTRVALRPSPMRRRGGTPYQSRLTPRLTRPGSTVSGQPHGIDRENRARADQTETVADPGEGLDDDGLIHTSASIDRTSA